MIKIKHHNNSRKNSALSDDVSCVQLRLSDSDDEAEVTGKETDKGTPREEGAAAKRRCPKTETKTWETGKAWNVDVQCTDKSPRSSSQEEGSLTERESTEPPSLGYTGQWILPRELTGILESYPGFSTTLLTLWEEHGLDPTEVRKLVFAYDKTFHLNDEIVAIRPRFSLCSMHNSGKGCVTFPKCQDLHICKGYLVGSCSDSKCKLGHEWLTNHNAAVLQSFYIDTLSPDVLSSLFQCTTSGYHPSGPLHVCRDYNDGECNRKNCDELHICSKFVQAYGKCQPACMLNHDFSEPSVNRLLKIHGLPTNDTPLDIIKALIWANLSLVSAGQFGAASNESLDELASSAVWSHNDTGDVETPEICYKSVMGLCDQEESGCTRLHAMKHYHWQVSEDGNTWLNLRDPQVEALEEAFCNPSNRTVILPCLVQAIVNLHAKRLMDLMGTQTWVADFDTMKLVCCEKLLQLRRLCTQAMDQEIPARTFLWYYDAGDSRWVKYTEEQDDELNTNTASEDIEKRFAECPTQKIRLVSKRYTYTLDFSSMTQTNDLNQRERQVRRRPQPRLQEENTEKGDLPDFWDPIGAGVTWCRKIISKFSDEYDRVRSLLEDCIEDSEPIKVERIQNPFLWWAFQNKIQELTGHYKDPQKVNVQQLFHGTSANVVENICAENFDWRLNGTSSGCKYGRGSYFSTRVAKALLYCPPDPSESRYLFIAQVAVGAVVKGNASMVRPTFNYLTGRLYDSTVDDEANPTVIVKYDKQEYYPEYLVTLEKLNHC